jgi:hypothetical protein
LNSQDFEVVQTLSDDQLKQRAALETIKLKKKLLEFSDDYYWTQLLVHKSTTVRKNESPGSWTGWSAFYLELTNSKQMEFCGEFVLLICHLVPAILALCYLVDNDLFDLLKLAIYIDLSFDLVDVLCMAISQLAGKNYSIPCFPSIFFWILYVHHGLGMSFYALAIVIGADPVYVANFMFVMLGVSGISFLVADLLRDYTPLSENLRASFIASLISFSVIVTVRVCYWIYLFARGMEIAFGYSIIAGVVAAIIYLTFTAYALYMAHGEFHRVKSALDSFKKSQKSEDSAELKDIVLDHCEIQHIMEG